MVTLANPIHDSPSLFTFFLCYDERREISLLNHSTDSRDIFRFNLLPLLQLLIELPVEYLENIQLRLGRRRVATVDHVTERVETLVEHARKSEVGFRTFHIHLNELLLNGRHFVFESVGGIERWLESLVVAETRVQIFDLRSEVANFIDCLVELRNAIVHLHGQGELLLQGGFCAFSPRIDGKV